MTQKTDILVLGATGFTGKLVVRYLSTHPDYTSTPPKFSFGLAGRSLSKLSKLADELSLPEHSVPRVVVDTASPAQIDAAILSTRVVINVVGPFWKYSRPVVVACAERGVHYVDLTGEPPFMHFVVDACDASARASKAIIVPAAGQDCVPSDLTLFLANKTLKARFPGRSLGHSTSVFRAWGDISGGTLATLFSIFEDIPAEARKLGQGAWALSPLKGLPQPGLKLTYDLPHDGIVGGLWAMASVDKAVVQRSWGLFERAAQANPDDAQAKENSYGPELVYDEFFETGNKLFGALFTAVLVLMVLLAAFWPTRWLMKKLLPQPGTGPSESALNKGYIKINNLTYSSADASGKRALVRTRMDGKGDPGYLLASVLISESALALALDYEKLPALARAGGALTPATAIGDVLLDRLSRTDKISFESQIEIESV
jgi:short subunit dehydrogenase-like uncharacterized protein